MGFPKDSASTGHFLLYNILPEVFGNLPISPNFWEDTKRIMFREEVAVSKTLIEIPLIVNSPIKFSRRRIP
ncbi:MAG: hypothetical protein C0393_01050 [Anaerolinea sp.]|nr:hypothetical protein [Anaerolinea sp.]